MGNPFLQPPQGGSASPTSTPQPQTNGAADPTNAAGLNEQVEVAIDPNDPMLTSESLTAQEGDAFATPPPPPDGKWRVKLKHEGITKKSTNEVIPWEGWQQKDRNQNVVGLYARTVMSVAIQDPSGKYDGYHLQIPFFYIDTKSVRNGPSKVMTVLNLLRKPDGTPWLTPGEKLNHKGLMERFIQALQSEPEIGAESNWEVVCDVCAKEAKAHGSFAKATTGMTKFQASKTVRGQYDPDFQCQTSRGHGFTRARALAVRFFPLAELGK